VESAAIGLIAARFAAAERRGERNVPPPPTTAHGALLGHITGGHIETIDAGPRSFQPMNVNFGLFPPIALGPKPVGGKRLRGPEKALARKRALTARALADLDRWIAGEAQPVAAE
jgi:methylenetetrahydrofolate--tRNA-(uracil-5-)-methyltransferase